MKCKRIVIEEDEEGTVMVSTTAQSQTGVEMETRLLMWGITALISALAEHDPSIVVGGGITIKWNSPTPPSVAPADFFIRSFIDQAVSVGEGPELLEYLRSQEHDYALTADVRQAAGELAEAVKTRMDMITAQPDFDPDMAKGLAADLDKQRGKEPGSLSNLPSEFQNFFRSHGVSGGTEPVGS